MCANSVFQLFKIMFIIFYGLILEIMSMHSACVYMCFCLSQIRWANVLTDKRTSNHETANEWQQKKPRSNTLFMFYNTNFLWDMNKNLANNCNGEWLKKELSESKQTKATKKTKKTKKAKKEISWLFHLNRCHLYVWTFRWFRLFCAFFAPTAIDLCGLLPFLFCCCCHQIPCKFVVRR